MKHLFLAVAISFLGSIAWGQPFNVLTELKIFLDKELVSSPRLLTLEGRSGNIKQSNDGNSLATKVKILKVLPGESVTMDIFVQEMQGDEVIRSTKNRITVPTSFSKVIENKESDMRLEVKASITQ